MEENPKPRRSFRFSLRTMLVLVTVVCIYLAWAMNWIRQRREFLSRPGVIAMLHAGAPPAPMPLHVLGENGVSYLWILNGFRKVPPETIDTAEGLFPESEIIAARATQD
jgi:hypothetical protein